MAHYPYIVSVALICDWDLQGLVMQQMCVYVCVCVRVCVCVFRCSALPPGTCQISRTTGGLILIPVQPPCVATGARGLGAGANVTLVCRCHTIPLTSLMPTHLRMYMMVPVRGTPPHQHRLQHRQAVRFGGDRSPSHAHSSHSSSSPWAVGGRDFTG